MFINSNLKKKSLLSLSAVAAVALLSGCNSDTYNPGTTVTAVDGYILGANIIDANGITASKNGDGTYTFPNTPRYPLTATGGTLKDTGETFTGTMYASEGVVVSPLTTFITTLDANGNPTTTVDSTRVAKLASITGVAASEFTKDFMATGNLEIAKLAQLVQVMNQNDDLMTEFKEKVDASTLQDGFNSLKIIADDAIDAMTANSTLSTTKQTVYKNILNDIDGFTGDVKDIEADLKDTKVALSNIAAIETIGGELGTDADSLLTASALVTIAGNPDSTETLTSAQLTTLGVSSTITDDATLSTFMTDIIKNGTSINSKAEVTTYSTHLTNLFQLDTQVSAPANKTDLLVTAAAAISGITIADYQAYELDAILDTSAQEVDTYAKLITLIEGLAVITSPIITVTPEASFPELLNGVGIKIGDTVATASATFDTDNLSVLKEFRLSGTDAINFDINTTTGVITSKVNFDYETKKAYTFTVNVTSKHSGDLAGDGSDVTVGTDSKIITLNVTDVNDFGIQSVSIDLGSTDASTDDTIHITFSSDVETTGVTAADFELANTTFDSAATATYNAIARTYTISGGTAASALGDTINISNNVKQEGNDENPLVTSMSLEKFSLSGTTGYNGTFTDSNNVSYGVVQSTDTAKFWLDRNLGASQVATSVSDADSFGGYYQWGRSTDGHQLSNSGLSATLASSITTTDSNFITVNALDWADTGADDTGALRTAIWSDAYHTAQICPTGFRVPTLAELEAETVGASTPVTNASTGFSSFLKLSLAGYRNGSAGSVAIGSGNFWSSEVVSSNSKYLAISSTAVTPTVSSRNHGFSIRCIKD